MLLPRKHRVRAREIACDCWLRAGFTESAAIDLTKKTVADDKARGTYGNPLVAFMIAYYVASLCYMAYKIWRENHVNTPPAVSTANEPFGLHGGAR